jgi:hypothetical protein
MMASNMTSGDHPYNASGVCMALVAQWLMEIKFDPGAAPEVLGRYLLQNDLGTHGYGGIASSQSIYGTQSPGFADHHSGMVDRHSGGALTRGNDANVTSSAEHWNHIQAGLYGGGTDGSFRLGAHARVYSAHMALAGENSWMIRMLAGSTWGHAIGIHSDGNRVYFFDPNYGVFIFDEAARGSMATFIAELWTQYGATAGRLAQVT